VDSVEMKKKLFNLIYLQHTSSSTEKQNTIINGYRIQNINVYNYILNVSTYLWENICIYLCKKFISSVQRMFFIDVYLWQRWINYQKVLAEYPTT
jgi:hypothetical protein